MKVKSVVAAVAAVVCVSAHASYRDGNKLYSEMQDPSYIIQAFAMGYVGGVADSMNLIVFCIPSSVTLKQANDTVQAYLFQNPQTRHYSADVLVNYALKAAWPCKKGGA